MITAMTMTAAPGYYDDGTGRRRWWDGAQWTEHYEAPAPVPVAMYAQPQVQQWQQQDPRSANRMPVSYVRPQQGHSLTLHLLLCCVVIGLFTVPYYSMSPNHYWHI